MNALYLTAGISILLLAGLAVLIVTSRQRPERGEILLRSGFGKTVYSSSNSKSLFCIPGLHTTYSFENRPRRIQFNNQHSGPILTSDGLSVFYEADCVFNLQLSADSLLKLVVEDDSINNDGLLQRHAARFIASTIRLETIDKLLETELHFKQDDLRQLTPMLKPHGYFAFEFTISEITLEPSDGPSGNARNKQYEQNKREEQKRQSRIEEQKQNITELESNISDLQVQLTEQLQQTKELQSTQLKKMMRVADQSKAEQAHNIEQQQQLRVSRATQQSAEHYKKNNQLLEAKLREEETRQRDKLRQITENQNQLEVQNTKRIKDEANRQLTSQQELLQQIEDEASSHLARIDEDAKKRQQSIDNANKGK